MLASVRALYLLPMVTDPAIIVKVILLSITNKMQHYTIIFITVNALHVSGGFSAHHQSSKLYTQQWVYAKLPCCYC